MKYGGTSLELEHRSVDYRLGEESMADHHHEHERYKTASDIRKKLKNVPGVIVVESKLHDDAVVISGYLTVISDDRSFSENIAIEMETAAREITEQGGIVGHIKATSVVTSTKMISITDEKAMIKEAPECRVQITLAAIVFLVNPEETGNIIKQTLARIRTHSNKYHYK